MTTPLLKITDLHASAGGKKILNGLSLQVNRGEVHAIMGPNGSGKSTVSYIIAGKPGYEITSGTIEVNGKNILGLNPEERAQMGVFLAFQYPVEVPGVNNIYFLRAAVNAVRKSRGQDEIEAGPFLKLAREKLKILEMSGSFLNRGVNEGFSGGEKKRNEVFQMSMLEPQLAILDETDSGLDIDALKIVAKGVNALRNDQRSFLVITHYQRLLDYIVPDYVHVLAKGKIIRSGDKNLALELEKSGYDWLNEDNA